MKRADLRKQMVAIALAVLWLAVAFVVVWLAEIFDRIEGAPSPPVLIEGPVLIALMLLPLGVYFVASGKLTWFKVAGLLEAGFAEKAEKIATTIDFNDLQKVGRKQLEAQARQNPSQPVVMKMTIGRKVGYTVPELRRHLDFLLPVRSFKLVVFLDSNQEVVAYMEAWRLKELVDQDELADEFVQSINSGEKQSVIGNPSVTDKVIPTSSTNIDALGEMQKQNLEALVVVNNQGKLAGVVERDQVLTSIVLSLAR
jgi:hypothetical protein